MCDPVLFVSFHAHNLKNQQNVVHFHCQTSSLAGACWVLLCFELHTKLTSIVNAVRVFSCNDRGSVVVIVPAHPPYRVRQHLQVIVDAV